MSTTRLLFDGWSANPVVLFTVAAAAIGFGRGFGRRARWWYFGAAVAVVLLTLLSPLNALADGVLFSAHMTQHILLLLVAPALLLLSLPRDVLPRVRARPWLAGFGWVAGVGSMWLWHVPNLCDAAATNAGVQAFQTVSLLAMGSLFWWPILAPADHQRLKPGVAVGYLFSACLACTALGILLTLTPIEVCPVFRAPLAGSTWAFLRERLTAERDRQIGGLLMWIPMCLVYVAAIMVELARWFGAPAKPSTHRT